MINWWCCDKENCKLRWDDMLKVNLSQRIAHIYNYYWTNQVSHLYGGNSLNVIGLFKYVLFMYYTYFAT